MKKIIILASTLTLLMTTSVWAAVQDEVESGLLTNMCISTYTSEPCGIAGEKSGMSSNGAGGQLARYRCEVCGADAFIVMISDIYKFVFFISLIIGVLMILTLGIGMSFSGVASEDMKAKSKEKIKDIVYGLIAMSLIPWILKTLAPFFFK